MRVLFLIPKNNPPQLTGNYTKPFKEFVEACLNKDPENRPTAKELLKTPFIRKAKKNPYLIDLIDRYKKWRTMHNGDSGTDSDNSDSEGSHTGNDASDPWINTVTSIESIVARSGYPDNNRDSWADKTSSSSSSSSSPSNSNETTTASPTSPTSSAPAASVVKSPTQQNGNSTSSYLAPDPVQMSKSPSKELSPNKQEKRLQPSPSRASDVKKSTEEIKDHREREPERARGREKYPAPLPNKELRHSISDEPDTKQRSANSRTKSVNNAVPAIISPLLSDLSKRYHSNNSSSSKTVDELQHAFELAEQSSPGITELLIKDMLSKMMPNLTEAKLRHVVDRIIKDAS
jgi:serine/threonine-protein kinase 24/25/MST4